MKTNTLKIITATVASLAIVLVAATKTNATYVDLMAMGVSYSAVAILIALAAVDHRSSVKDYAAR
jgi:hypothetical protein